MTARRDARGKRLSDAPEYAGVVEPAVRGEILDALAPIEGRRILDVGTGTGRAAIASTGEVG